MCWMSPPWRTAGPLWDKARRGGAHLTHQTQQLWLLPSLRRTFNHLFKNKNYTVCLTQNGCVITEQLINRRNNSKQDCLQCSRPAIILLKNPEIWVFNTMVLKSHFCSWLTRPNTMNLHTYFRIYLYNHNPYSNEHSLTLLNTPPKDCNECAYSRNSP